MFINEYLINFKNLVFFLILDLSFSNNIMLISKYLFINNYYDLIINGFLINFCKFYKNIKKLNFI